MGIISIVKASNLLWLGRYAERTYTTLDSFNNYYDQMIDKDEDSYKDYCNHLGIPDIYGDKEAFSSRYLYDVTDPNSVVSNLTRAHDNAIVIRDEIKSSTLSYLEMALNILKKGAGQTPTWIENQKVLDYLLAFWGCVDDFVTDEECRNIIKAGKYVERIDLYLRLSYPYEKIYREYTKLTGKLSRSHIKYNEDALESLREIVRTKDPERMNDYEALLYVNKLFEVNN